MQSVSDIIAKLGGATAVAARLGVPGTTVASWKHRGSIPDEYRPGLIAMAANAGISGITYEFLTLLHAKRTAPAQETAGSNAA